MINIIMGFRDMGCYTYHRHHLAAPSLREVYWSSRIPKIYTSVPHPAVTVSRCHAGELLCAACRPTSPPHSHPWNLAWNVGLSTLVPCVKTSSWRSHRAVVSSRAGAGARSAVTNRGRVAHVLRGMGRPQLFLPLGRASSAGLQATEKPNTVHQFFCFFIFFYNSRNLYKLLKYIENKIQLKKYKLNFVRILLSRSMQ
jgi:hypothetical protein